MKTSRAAQTASIIVAGLAAMTLVTASAAVTAGPGCTPGSGRNLAGRNLTGHDFSQAVLRCANFTGADLNGVSLSQADLTGALLKDAKLQNADLTQATLVGADLTGADLTGAKLIQATAQHVKLTGANLSGADLTQADLTGANLAHANLRGASFTQATLDGAIFTGATGVPPYAMYLLIATAVILVLLLLGSVRKSARALQAARGGGFGGPMGPVMTVPRNPAVVLARGIIGAVIIAIGFHLFIGGLLDEILSATGPPLAQLCTGPLCKVGVASGFLGVFIGVPVMLVGFAVRSVGTSTRRATPTAAGQFGPYGPVNPSGPF